MPLETRWGRRPSASLDPTHHGSITDLDPRAPWLARNPRRFGRNQPGNPRIFFHKKIWKVPRFKARRALAFGLLLVALGASLLVDGSVNIARDFGISETIIGVTLVAIGTSLPELATSVQAARHGNSSVAIGNVIGSNLFNIAAIMGITAAVAGPVPVASHVVSFDSWIMAASTIFLIALTMFKGVRIGKRIGGLMLAIYAAYLVATVMI